MLGGEPHGPIPVHHRAQLEAHTGRLEPGPPPGEQRLVELEGRHPGGEQAADLAVAVVDGHRPARGVQPLGAGEPRRSGADHRHAAPDVRRAGAPGRGPAGRQGAIQDGPLHGADGHRTPPCGPGRSHPRRAGAGGRAGRRPLAGGWSPGRSRRPRPSAPRPLPPASRGCGCPADRRCGSRGRHNRGSAPPAAPGGQDPARCGSPANHPADRRRAAPGWARGRRSLPAAPPAAGWHRAARQAERGCAHRGWPGHRWGTRRRSGRSPCSPPGP